jgi:hypothetical protein
MHPKGCGSEPSKLVEASVLKLASLSSNEVPIYDDFAPESASLGALMKES